MSMWASWEYWLNVRVFSLLENVSLNTSKCLSKTQHFIQVLQVKECGVVQLPRIPPSLPAQKLSSKLEQSLCCWWNRVVGRETFSWLCFMKWILLPSHTRRWQVEKWLWKLAFSPAARILLCLHVRSGRRSLFWFVFCFLKALKRCVTCCSVITAFLHLFGFGSWLTVSCSWKMPSKDVGRWKGRIGCQVMNQVLVDMMH